MSYWVTSELNPRYIQYRTAIEYHSIYRVVSSDGEVVATFDWPGRYRDARERAYQMARELNAKDTQT